MLPFPLSLFLKYERTLLLKYTVCLITYLHTSWQSTQGFNHFFWYPHDFLLVSHSNHVFILHGLATVSP